MTAKLRSGAANDIWAAALALRSTAASVTADHGDLPQACGDLSYRWDNLDRALTRHKRVVSAADCDGARALLGATKQIRDRLNALQVTRTPPRGLWERQMAEEAAKLPGLIDRVRESCRRLARSDGEELELAGVQATEASDVEPRLPDLPISTDTVFIVAGWDSAVNDAIEDFVRALNLKPLLWEGSVGKTGSASPSTLDTVRAGLAAAGAVLILFTPDELARPRQELEARRGQDRRLQPRPNVLFEAGAALGLSAEFARRAIIVEVGMTHCVSDIAGLNTVRMMNYPQSLNQLKDRLTTAGVRPRTEGDAWLHPSKYAALFAPKTVALEESPLPSASDEGTTPPRAADQIASLSLQDTAAETFVEFLRLQNLTMRRDRIPPLFDAAIVETDGAGERLGWEVATVAPDDFSAAEQVVTRCAAQMATRQSEFALSRYVLSLVVTGETAGEAENAAIDLLQRLQATPQRGLRVQCGFVVRRTYVALALSGI